MVELCRIKLLILSLPEGQSALMNKSGILFNITLKRCRGINTNLCQIHCSKKKYEVKLGTCFKELVTATNHHYIFVQCLFCEL